MFIDEANMALGIFLVILPCMLPTPLCGIFPYNWNLNKKKMKKYFGPYVVHLKCSDSPYVVHFIFRDSPYVVHFECRDCPYVEPLST